jgi:hypothetical protein
VATLANVTRHSSADVLLSYVRTADLIADYPVAILRCSTTSGDGRRDRRPPMSNFEPYYVVIGPAAMLAIGTIVLWLITRLPD